MPVQILLYPTSMWMVVIGGDRSPVEQVWRKHVAPLQEQKQQVIPET